MFEHLDDPQPFSATEALRSTVVAAGGRLRRRRRLRLVGGGAAVVVVAMLAGGWAYVDRRDAAIDRVEVATQPSTDGAVNVLLLGDDSGLGLEPVSGGGRVDTAMLLRLDGTGAHLLSIPRDLADPATGERFSSLAAGGLQPAADAVRRVVGDLPVDHVVLLDFDGFVALVDAVGGIPIRVLRVVVDEPTGTELEPSDACQVLDGATALGLVRARHVVGDPTGDLGRIERQRVLLQAALAAADAGDVDALSRVLADHALVDDGLDLATVVDLARRLRSAGGIDVVELPVRSDELDGGAVVLRLAQGAGSALARFGATGPSPVPTDVLPGDAVDPEPFIIPC